MNHKLDLVSSSRITRIIQFAFSLLCIRCLVGGVDWDNDIVATHEDLDAEKNDALSKYFGESIQDEKLFPDYKAMQELVKYFDDVPIENSGKKLDEMVSKRLDKSEETDLIIDDSSYAPETLAVMKWMSKHPFVLSANFHAGSLGVSYPFDQSFTRKEHYNRSPDDKLFTQLSYRYARAHPSMWKTGRRCDAGEDGDVFLHGITNGAAWYPLKGGMQDWQYEYSNCMEITIEMGCYKFPTDTMIPKLWEEHKYSLLSFLQTVHSGIKGIVKNTQGMPVYKAVVSIVRGGQGKNVETTMLGEYWRLLSPGDYIIRISHKDYRPERFDVKISQIEESRIINVVIKLKKHRKLLPYHFKKKF